ncbi:MAG: c-type cytochrome [Bacteroidia bacterium]|nr:c-type cytochrome [Bacteroidia bacterium]MCX7651261.1 c-type cytochrome [Bacteroidia bacterium]MDW8416209.1 c-type cytochrome [Bacteroidia bacterium]
MDTGILHTHHLLAVLLLVLVGAPIVFSQWAQRLKKVHMVLDTLLVLTGVYLLLKAPEAFSPPYLLKYILTLAAVGLAIAGSRRNNKRLSIAAFFLLTYAYGLSLQRDFFLKSEAQKVEKLAVQAPSVAEGQKLYSVLCSRCHGSDGQAKYRKSPSLHPIQNPDTNYWAAVIRNGKGMMPAHTYLSDNQISSLIAYLRSWQ